MTQSLQKFLKLKPQRKRQEDEEDCPRKVVKVEVIDLVMDDSSIRNEEEPDRAHPLDKEKKYQTKNNSIVTDSPDTLYRSIVGVTGSRKEARIFTQSRKRSSKIDQQSLINLTAEKSMKENNSLYCTQEFPIGFQSHVNRYISGHTECRLAFETRIESRQNESFRLQLNNKQLENEDFVFESIITNENHAWMYLQEVHGACKETIVTLRNSLPEEKSSDQLLYDKYKPLSLASCLIGTDDTQKVANLKTWLGSFRPLPTSQVGVMSSQLSSNYSSSEDESDFSEYEELTRRPFGRRKRKFEKAFSTLFGPDGEFHKISTLQCHVQDFSKCKAILLHSHNHFMKTTLISILGKEFNFEIVEVNASMKRDGSVFTNLCAESLQSHRINQKEAAKSFFMKKVSSFKRTSMGKMTMLVVEDVDVLYAEDAGFWAALLEMVETSRRPIIITCTNVETIPYEAMRLISYDLIGVMSLKGPSKDELAAYISAAALHEGVLFERSAAQDLFEDNMDLRRALNKIHFMSLKTTDSVDGSFYVYSHKRMKQVLDSDDLDLSLIYVRSKKRTLNKSINDEETEIDLVTIDAKSDVQLLMTSFEQCVREMTEKYILRTSPEMPCDLTCVRTLKSASSDDVNVGHVAFTETLMQYLNPEQDEYDQPDLITVEKSLYADYFNLSDLYCRKRILETQNIPYLSLILRSYHGKPMETRTRSSRKNRTRSSLDMIHDVVEPYFSFNQQLQIGVGMAHDNQSPNTLLNLPDKSNILKLSNSSLGPKSISYDGLYQSHSKEFLSATDISDNKIETSDGEGRLKKDKPRVMASISAVDMPTKNISIDSIQMIPVSLAEDLSAPSNTVIATGTIISPEKSFLESPTGRSKAGSSASSLSPTKMSPISPNSLPNFPIVFAADKRNVDFHLLFRSVPDTDRLIEDFTCAYQREILVHGRMYISQNHICFNSKIFGWITNLVISFTDVLSIERKMSAFVIPNALLITTLHAKHFFASLVYREQAFYTLFRLWKAALGEQIDGLPFPTALKYTPTSEGGLGESSTVDSDVETEERQYPQSVASMPLTAFETTLNSNNSTNVAVDSSPQLRKAESVSDSGLLKQQGSGGKKVKRKWRAKFLDELVSKVSGSSFEDLPTEPPPEKVIDKPISIQADSDPGYERESEEEVLDEKIKPSSRLGKISRKDTFSSTNSTNKVPFFPSSNSSPPKKVDNHTLPKSSRKSYGKKSAGKHYNVIVEPLSAKPPKPPVFCNCQDHCKSVVMDRILPIPLHTLASVLYGSGSFFERVYKSFGFVDIIVGSWVKGEGVEKRKIQYGVPIKFPFAPKYTQCIVIHKYTRKESNRVFCVRESISVPNVPGGSSFRSISSQCIMRVGERESRIIVAFEVEFIKNTWLRGPLEKNAIEGNLEFWREFERLLISECSSLTLLPLSPVNGASIAASTLPSPVEKATLHQASLPVTGKEMSISDIVFEYARYIYLMLLLFFQNHLFTVILPSITAMLILSNIFTVVHIRSLEQQLEEFHQIPNVILDAYTREYISSGTNSISMSHLPSWWFEERSTIGSEDFADLGGIDLERLSKESWVKVRSEFDQLLNKNRENEDKLAEFVKQFLHIID